MMTALWSVNLYIAGTSNVPLFSQKTIFKNKLMDGMVPKSLRPYSTLILILILVMICKVLLDLYLKTKSGYLLRAVGDNEALVTALAKDQGNVKILGLSLANGLVAMAGSIFAQEERVFEISIGTRSNCNWSPQCDYRNEFVRKMTVFKATTAVLIGSIIYRRVWQLLLKTLNRMQ